MVSSYCFLQIYFSWQTVFMQDHGKRINSKRIHYQKVILDIFLQFFVLVICIIRNDWNQQTFYIAFCKIYSVPYIYQSGLSPKYRFVFIGSWTSLYRSNLIHRHYMQKFTTGYPSVHEISTDLVQILSLFQVGKLSVRFKN